MDRALANSTVDEEESATNVAAPNGAPATVPNGSPTGGSNGARPKVAPDDGHGLKVAELRGDLDRISLEQSLVDFEVANARVVDLTQRLLDAAAEIRRLRTEIDSLHVAQGKLEAELDKTRSTKAYRFAEKVWEIRRALNV